MNVLFKSYKLSYTLLLWVTMACAIITCPVKKGLRTVSHLPVNSQSGYVNPGSVHTCVSINELTENSTHTEQGKRYTPAAPTALTQQYTHTNTAVAQLYSTTILRNGPPLFLRHRQILI